jgi:hypothetical protein
METTAHNSVRNAYDATAPPIAIVAITRVSKTRRFIPQLPSTGDTDITAQPWLASYVKPIAALSKRDLKYATFLL